MVDDGGGSQQGWLAALDRDINKNFRIGVGYNFTEFSDDLTDFDYDQRSWFVNLTGATNSLEFPLVADSGPRERSGPHVVIMSAFDP